MGSSHASSMFPHRPSPLSLCRSKWPRLLTATSRTLSSACIPSCNWSLCGSCGNKPGELYAPTHTDCDALLTRMSLTFVKRNLRYGVYHFACRRGKRKPVPFATVVTDLTTCHNTWFHPLVDRCFVPTLYCKRSAMKNGLKEEQVRP